MCAKMPIVIESVGDQGQRVEQASIGPTTARSSASRKKAGGGLEYRARRPKSKLKARPATSPRWTQP
jgi:hypothetical protein